MGNICESMGMSRKDPKKIENSTIDPRFSNSERTSDDEIKSPVPNSAALAMSNEAVKAAELKAAYTKKAKEEAEAAAAAAAITQMKGPRIRLLPHQHTLFCERKQRVCTSSGQLQEMEVLVLEGFDGPLPPFTWIRIDPAHLRYFAEDFEGLVAPAFYQEAQQEHPLGGDGQPTHADNEYVLTREDVGFYMGVRYDVVRESDVCLSRSSTPGPPPPPSAIELITGDAEAETEAEVGAEEQQQTGEDAPEYKFIVLSTHGVVKPGPPRLTTFDIGGTMKVGSVAVAEVCYIGGYEGYSSYWWLRVTPDGKRIQVTEPQRVPFPSSAARQHSSAEFAVRASFSSSSYQQGKSVDGVNVLMDAAALTNAQVLQQHGAGGDGSSQLPGPGRSFSMMSDVDPALIDPRMYLLTEDDVGCTLKVKCRPVRSDGVEGEIFTSSASEEVQA